MSNSSLLNADKIAAAQITISALFRDALDNLNKLDPIWDQLAVVVNAATPTVTHLWLGDVPGFQEFKDERVIGKLQASNYQITVKDWGNGLEIFENDVEDDNLGIYTPKITALAQKAKIHKLELLMDFLVNGFATTKYGPAYDGVPFFSAAHVGINGTALGGGSNLIHNTLDDTTAFIDAYVRMVSLVDQSGQNAGFRPSHLIHGPKNIQIVDALLGSEYLANGGSNPNYHRVQPLLSGKLIDYSAINGGPDLSNMWFLVDANSPMKPLIWQVRRDVRFRSVGASGGQGAGGDTDYVTFMRRKLFFGADARWNAGYGMWQAVVGSDGTS